MNTGSSTTDAAAAGGVQGPERAARDSLKELIVTKGAALVEAAYDFDDLIERWIELGFDPQELATAINGACYDVGTNIEEFVGERVEVAFEQASENVMFNDAFHKALAWWRGSGLGPQDAFDNLQEPQFAPDARFRDDDRFPALEHGGLLL